MEKVITKIDVQKRNKDRVNVYVDGEFSFSCSTELIYTHGVKLNKSVDIEVLKGIAEEDNYLKCKNSALRIIERSYKTEKEIYDKLILKGYNEKTLARVIEFLKSYNLLNDEAYSKLYIKEKIKSQGKNKIKNNLLRKGLDKDLVEEKLKEIDGDKEYNIALNLAEKKYLLLLKIEKDVNKITRKIWEYLFRNGYSSELIEEIVKKVVIPQIEEGWNEENIIDLEELQRLAEKRYKIIAKSENDKAKIYKKLSDFLLRKGYSYESVKDAMKDILV